MLGGRREAAFAAAMDFSKGQHIAEAARSLYLAEVVLAHDAPQPEEARAALAQSAQSSRYGLRPSISCLIPREDHLPSVNDKGGVSMLVCDAIAEMCAGHSC